MLIKYTKIFTLGLGAIMASGVPSGQVMLQATHSETRPAKYYRLASPPIVYDAKSKAAVVSYSPSFDTGSGRMSERGRSEPVEESAARTQESSYEPTVKLGAAKFDKDTQKPGNWSVLNYASRGIVIINQYEGITRAMSARHTIYAEAPRLTPANYGLFPYNAPAWEHPEPAEQIITSDAGPSFVVDPLDFKDWMAEEAPEPALEAPAAPEPVEESVVPEPTGILALAMGLPGAAVLRRRRTRR